MTHHLLFWSSFYLDNSFPVCVIRSAAILCLTCTVIFIWCLHLCYRHVTEPHSRLPGWSPDHLYGGRSQGRKSSDHDRQCFEPLGRAGHTQITQITLHHIQIMKMYITCVHTHMCRHTCKPLDDSASFSAKPPQGLEQDKQMDLPLADTSTMRVSQAVFCGV